MPEQLVAFLRWLMEQKGWVFAEETWGFNVEEVA
jgi:hypothetical protein